MGLYTRTPSFASSSCSPPRGVMKILAVAAPRAGARLGEHVAQILLLLASVACIVGGGVVVVVVARAGPVVGLAVALGLASFSLPLRRPAHCTGRTVHHHRSDE